MAPTLNGQLILKGAFLKMVNQKLRLSAGSILLAGTLALGFALPTLTAAPTPAIAEEWGADETQFEFTGWNQIEDDWYYVQEDGTLARGWLKVGGKWFWLDPETGAMATGRQDIDGAGYLFTDSGVMVTGWYKYDGDWYFAKKSGALASGWLKSGGKWYYFGYEDLYVEDSDEPVSSYRMYENETRFIGDKKYSFGRSGAMVTGWYQNHALYDMWFYHTASGEAYSGWLKSGGKWYYLDPDAQFMYIGRHKIKGIDYYFSNSGAMQTGWVREEADLDYDGGWTYHAASGALKVGWLKSGGKWYYLDPDNYGYMVAGETMRIGGKDYTFNASGAWVK